MVRPSTHGSRRRTLGRRKKRASRRRQKSLKSNSGKISRSHANPALRPRWNPSSTADRIAGSDGPCRPRSASRRRAARKSALRPGLDSDRSVASEGSRLCRRGLFSAASRQRISPRLRPTAPAARRRRAGPSSDACRAETFRPVSSIGNAASKPTNSGKRWVPPQAGSRPNLISGRPSRVASSSRAIR